MTWSGGGHRAHVLIHVWPLWRRWAPSLSNKEKLIVSPKTAKKHSTLIDDAVTSSSAVICAEDSMQATVNLTPADATASDSHPEDPSLITVADDQEPPCDTDQRSIDGVADNGVASDHHTNAG